MTECCRLCFSKNNLLSMCGGKSRSIRNGLRKMIEYTVNILIEPNDCMFDLCFNCCVDASNFYLFKLNSLQNEEKLKSSNLLYKNKEKKRKLDIPHLKDVPLPDIEFTMNVMKWLGTKRVQLQETESKSKNTNYIDISIQTDQPEICEASSQTDVHESLSSESQTTPVHLADVAVQFTSESLSKKSRSSQTKNGLFKSPKTIRKDVFVQCHFESPSPLGYKKGYPEVSDSSSQTEVVDCLNQESQCDLLKLNGYRNYVSPGKTLTSSDQIYPSLTESDPYQRDVDTNLQITISFSDKIKKEKLSPGGNSLVSTQSPAVSPSSCGLLDNKKSINMSICRWCDKPLYKKEIARHRRTHMNCKFCKRKFVSFRETKKHMAECMLWRENAVIKLKKVDHDPFIMKLYKTAFEELNG